MNWYDNIPKILTAKPNWVVWGLIGEAVKAPFNPAALVRLQVVPAKSGVPGTWGRFEAAVGCVSKGLALGIGYEFDGSEVYGVDLDHVVDDNGAITPQALEIVEGLQSYTERSPSGSGLHIFVTAEDVNITRHRRQGGFVEIYSDARYFTVTGDIYADLERIAERSTELQRLHDRYLLSEPSKTVPPAPAVEPSQHAEESLQRGLARDAVLRACWNGQLQRGDESASDLALMNKLAYWLSADPGAMTTAFFQSPYYAGKDEAHKKKCQRPDYLPNTVKTACASLRSTAQEDTVRYQQTRNRGDAR